MKDKHTLALDAIYSKESSKILAVLLRSFGSHNLNLAEDCLQETFIAAINEWHKNGTPANPAAWLMLTAKNKAIDVLRTDKRRRELLDLAPEFKSEWTLGKAMDKYVVQNSDPELDLMFWIAASPLELEKQLPVIMKYLLGMSNTAIAKALFLQQEAVKKRIQRAKSTLSDQPFPDEGYSYDTERLPIVHLALYLLFNEAIHPRTEQSLENNTLIIRSIGLCKLLTQHPKTANSESHALYALMHFHHARLPSRNKAGYLNHYLEQQVRSQWSMPLIVKGSQQLNTALDKAKDDAPRFLLEALIAYEHCRAKSYEATNWQVIINHYQKLLKITDSPMFMLNLAVSYGAANHANLGIEFLETHEKAFDTQLQKSLWSTRAYLFALMKNKAKVTHCIEQACLYNTSQSEIDELKKRVQAVLQNGGSTAAGSAVF